MKQGELNHVDRPRAYDAPRERVALSMSATETAGADKARAIAGMNETRNDYIRRAVRALNAATIEGDK